MIMRQKFTREFKLLSKKHTALLNEINKDVVKEPQDTNNLLDYILQNLLYLRDLNLLDEQQNTSKEKYKQLDQIIDEYNAYTDCNKKYYKFEFVPEQLDPNLILLVPGTKDEVMQQCAKEEQKHWNKFWQLLALNIRNWRA